MPEGGIYSLVTSHKSLETLSPWSLITAFKPHSQTSLSGSFLRYILHWVKERDKIGKIFLSARSCLADRE